MATINPFSWFSSKGDSRRLSGLRPNRARKRRRSLRVESLEARQVLAAIVMTPYEQLLLELTNRARNDPAAEAARFGIGLNQGIAAGSISSTPKQPLAPNQILVDAAGSHSADMLANDYFNHTNLAEQSPSDRARAAGYPVGVWENISWGGSTGPIDYEANVYHRHERLFLSTTGHRQNMLHSSHQEAGTGVRFGQYTVGGWTYNAGMVTEKFGNPPGNNFLTGVVFTDASDGSAADNDFYNIGEQISSGTITATDIDSGQSYATMIGQSGGYSLQIPAGTYTVSAEGGDLPARYISENVVLGGENVKVDFETTTATMAPGQDPVTPEPVAHRYDFGTWSSPLEPGYTRVLGRTTYSSALGYGWLGSTVSDHDRGAGSDVSRDFHYRDLATFVVDVTGGTYNVIVTVGDEGAFSHDQEIFLEGQSVDTIRTDPGEVVTRTYAVTVTDGQLTLRLDGRGGIDPNMVISGLQVIEADGDQPIPTGQLTVTIADDTVSENGGITSGTVSRTGNTSNPLVVTLSSDDTGEAAVPSIVEIPAGQASAVFTINGVDDHTVDGTQTATILATAVGYEDGSDTLSVLDDDVPEEAPDAEPVAQRFDFGTVSSPLEPGYTRVTGRTTYNGSLGFGWLGGTVSDHDRGNGTDVSRDFHYRDLGTFVVDVPNGTYQVLVTVGDEGPYAHDQSIALEGDAVDSITTARGQVLTRTYTVAVDDGQLTLRLDGRGGVDPNMIISGLQVIEVDNDEPTPPAELVVTIADAAISESGGTTTGTVSRSGSTSGPLVVTLASDDTGEATVPGSVTIPAGLASIDFAISGVDDNVVDGTQAVTVSASASGFSGGDDRVDVLDDDVPDDDVPQEDPATEPLAQRFDFGTWSSPVESGYTKVTGSTTYNAALGHGWLTKVNAFDRQAGTDLARDFHYRDVGTYVVDVPDGTYNVIVTVGDQGAYPHDQQIFLEGQSVGSILTAAREVVSRTYEVAVNDGQLTLRLDGRGGVDPNMVISGLQVIEVPSTPALAVTIAAAAISENGGSTTGTVSRSGDTTESLTVNLSSDDPGKATVPASVTIPAGQTSVGFTINAVDDDVVEGIQTVTILAEASGFSEGNETLNLLDDELQLVEPIARRFDFGTDTSPLEQGYTRVTGSNTYRAALGYGWLGSVNVLDRGSGTDVGRDLHYRNVGTFVVDVTDGTYLVRLTTGDEGPYGHDQSVILEGVPTDSIATAAGQIVTRTYAVAVNDGQLTLRLDGRGGMDPNMVISGLQVIEVPDELASAASLSPENLDILFAALDEASND